MAPHTASHCLTLHAPPLFHTHADGESEPFLLGDDEGATGFEAATRKT